MFAVVSDMAIMLHFGGRPASKLSNSGSRGSLVRAFPSLFAFLLLLGFVVQGTAVQTHLHFSEHGASFASSGGGSAQSPKPGKDDPANCPLCQEAATAGAYLLPSVAVLPPPPVALRWIAGTTLATFGL